MTENSEILVPALIRLTPQNGNHKQLDQKQLLYCLRFPYHNYEYKHMNNHITIMNINEKSNRNMKKCIIHSSYVMTTTKFLEAFFFAKDVLK